MNDKICLTCQRTKPINKYYGTTRFNKRASCKVCVAVRQREYRQTKIYFTKAFPTANTRLEDDYNNDRYEPIDEYKLQHEKELDRIEKDGFDKWYWESLLESIDNGYNESEEKGV